MSTSLPSVIHDNEAQVHHSDPTKGTEVLKTPSSVEDKGYVSRGGQNRSIDDENDNDNDVEADIAPASMNLNYASRLIEGFRRSGDFDILEKGIAMLRDSLKEISNSSATYSEGTDTLGAALLLRFGLRGEIEDLKDSISFLQQALELSPPRHISNDSPSLNNLASALQARFKQFGDGQDLDEAIILHRRALDVTSPLSPDRPEFMSNLAVALRTRFQQGGEASDLDEAILLNRQALEHRLPPHQERARSLNNLALALQTRFEEQGEEEDLNEAISLHKQAIDLRPSSHPERANSFNSLASALHMRFLHRGEVDDLDEAISLYQQGLELRPPPHPNHFVFLLNITSALKARFTQKGDIEDLDKVIALYRKSLPSSFPPNPWHFDLLNGLASALGNRFKQKSDPQDLDEAISFRRQSLDLEPSPNQNRFISLNNLAMALKTRFEQRETTVDLDDAISLHRQVLELISALHPSYTDFSNNLAGALHTRFNQQSELQDLEAAIDLYRQAVKSSSTTSSSHIDSMSNLASALETQFNRRSDARDLDEAISLRRKVLEFIPPDSPNRTDFLNYLALPLQMRFKQRGDTQDLDDAISLYSQALKSALLSYPDRSIFLNNMASALQNRFEQEADVGDLNEAIRFYRQALETKPSPHSTHPEFLNNLASVLHIRFERQGNDLDLDEAIALHRQALEFGSPSHPNYCEFVSNLASALLTRFEKRAEAEDLDKAVLLHRQALEYRPPPYADHARCLNNLSLALQTRFEKRGKTQDLNQAISLLRQALTFRPSPHTYRPSNLNNLALALKTRFEKDGETKDLAEAISLHEQTLDLLPVGHENRPWTLQNFALLRISAHKKVGTEYNRSHLDQAVSLFSQAAHSIALAPSGRFYTASVWATYADFYEHHSALEAYRTALGVLPQLAAIDLDIKSRQSALASGTDGIARKAARLAIHANQLTKAVEFLETGRGIFWSQYLNLRSPIDQIPDTSIEIKEDLRRLSVALERGSHRDVSSTNLDNHHRLLLEEKAQHFKQLGKQWSDIIEKVRQLEGFEDFLRPPTLSTLQGAKETVAYLIANDGGSDCLILTSTQLHHIPLPNLSNRTLSGLVKLIRAARSKYDVPYSVIKEVVGPAAMRAVVDTAQHTDKGSERAVKPSIANPVSSDNAFRSILRFLWDEVVNPVIDILGLKKSDAPSTLRWCPTGLFTFIPVHAAGRYDKELIDCASDYFISSYTPTVGALLPKGQVATPEPFKMMVVIQSKSLPHTEAELTKIERYVGGDSLITYGVPTRPASVDAVASDLSGASIVHFACHGKQDIKKPLESGLVVEDRLVGEDGLLKISRIMEEAVPNGSLAFLSACETAMGDESMPDEAMSIGACLLFSGFRSVVATMWKMWDADGPEVADTFYRELFQDSDVNRMTCPDTSKSAYALHVAVKELRTSGVPFWRWVPFIHMGK